ncbi:MULTISPECIES: hypothetical protein [unclassified Chryseobacterium]|uniref:hypothetical protein n=1 Tax=unclassified Chryseobacterium TaxID=2593645 RepID=UPI00100BE03F|nr:MULTISPECIES: hypothetical protein [unclassified Chryseobacterium]RXM53317.1 hypothetical protein BOQ64_02820 [Chryseobacterium sp. CH25]RXM65484.1 hypothetical protein BOQ60_06670 [Chryseobacterium sp. CH1]
MKKLLFIAMLGVVGFVSAKGNVEKVNSKTKEATVAKSTKKAKKKLQMQCGTFQATCTSAYTCQDWTVGQWLEWGEKIQDNYCQL